MQLVLPQLLLGVTQSCAPCHCTHYLAESRASTLTFTHRSDTGLRQAQHLMPHRLIPHVSSLSDMHFTCCSEDHDRYVMTYSGKRVMSV